MDSHRTSTLQKLFFAICAASVFIVSNGSADSQSENPKVNTANELSGFDYAAFLARTPIPKDMDYDEENFLDSEEYNPSARNVEQVLQEWDEILIQADVPVSIPRPELFTRATKCKRSACAVWVFVDKNTQQLSLYIDGILEDTWLASTGAPGHGTPDFETNPDGRIYDKYSSKKYPGGDFNGLGNMPYAVFISGGFAIHGTPKSNWAKLGQKASHGCIRLHPDNGYRFNRLVREVGIKNTWISVD